MAKKSTSSKKKAARQGGDVEVRGSGVVITGSGIQASGSFVGGKMQQAGGDIVGGDKVGSDKVGRDKITTTTAGMTGDALARLFEQVASAVKQQAPAEKQAEAEQKVAELQAQAKAKQPDIGLVGKTLKWLKKNVPGVSGTLKSVLNQPIIGQSIKDIAAVILEEDTE